jgi:hypothetical protein
LPLPIGVGTQRKPPYIEGSSAGILILMRQDVVAASVTSKERYIMPILAMTEKIVIAECSEAILPNFDASGGRCSMPLRAVLQGG